MNVYLQIAGGLLFAFIGLFIILIRRKYFKFHSILISAVTLVAAVCFLYLGIGGLFSSKFSPYQKEYDLYLAKELIADEQYEEAEKILSKLYIDDASNPYYTLNLARTKALQGLNDRAKPLYEKAIKLYEDNKLSGFPDSEYDKITELVSMENSQDQAIVAYLSSNNLSHEEYGFTDKVSLEAIEAKEEEMIKDIKSNVRKEQSTASEKDKRLESFDSAVNLVVSTQQAYDNYIAGEEVEKKEISRLVRRFRDIEEEQPELLANQHVRLARLKALVLNGSYKQISNAANKNSSNDELMILSELYMKGFVKTSHFNEDFATIDQGVYDKVISQCEKVYSQKLSNERKQVRNIYKYKIDALKNQKKHKVLAEIKSRIYNNIDNEPKENTSKLYMQLSKIESYLDNKSQADDFMNSSIDTVGNCDDINYTEPMHEIIGIMSGNNTDETIKNVAQYVEQIVDNTLPVKVKDNNTTDENYEQDENRSIDDDFVDYFSNYVSKKRAIINIGAIDISNFNEVKARIHMDSEAAHNVDSLKDILKIYDCGIEIEDYKIEKLSFSKSRILLLCDISGSMDSNVDDLKNAVQKFIDNINKDEEISIVGFDDYIDFRCDFTTNLSELEDAVNKLGAYGGTNMYSAVQEALGFFPKEITSNDVIILMTDGHDNFRRSDIEIRENIGSIAKDNSITIYTIGLGQEVDEEYLTSIANAGNGKFLYVKDSNSLSEFYNFIHNQLENQYLITYKAANTIDNYRELKVSIPSEGVSDRREYYLVEPDEEISDEEYERIVSEGDGLQVYGLQSKFLYKSDSDMVVILRGKGFNKEDEVSVEAIGNLSYNLKAEYVDESRLNVLIPNNISVGTYDLKVSTKGNVFKLNRELTVEVPGDEKVYKFGPYTFTALKEVRNNENQTTLRGNVTMNGWLRFKGDIIISHDRNRPDEITVLDRDGSYVSFSTYNSKGLAKLCGELGYPVSILPLEDFKLYDDVHNKYDFDNYRVDDIHTVSIPVYCLFAENARINLYPDSIKFHALELNTDLPYMNKIIKASGYNPFQFKGDFTGVVSNKAIGMVGSIEIGKDRYDTKLKNFSIVNRLPLSLKEAVLEYDTLSNDYSFMAQVYLFPVKARVGEDSNDETIGFEFALKDMKLDKLMLYADAEFTPVKSPVPLTFSDFGIGLTGMSDKAGGEDYNALLDSYLTGKFDVSAFKLSGAIPKKIAKFLGDPSLITVSDATVKMRLREFALCFNADVKLFDLLKVGYCDVKIGNFSYENALLNIREMDVKGLYFKHGAGIFWESKNLNFEGSMNVEYTVGSPYIGFWGNGTLITTINWWEFEKNLKTSGDFVLALFVNSDNKVQFSVVVKDKAKDRRLDIVESKIKVKL